VCTDTNRGVLRISVNTSAASSVGNSWAPAVTGGTGACQHPYIDGSGRVFITQSNTQQIVVLTGLTNTVATVLTTTFLTTPLSGLQGIAGDASGQMYVTSTSPAAVYKLSQQGAVTSWLTTSSCTGAALAGPVSLTFDSATNWAYVVAGTNSAWAWKVSPTGQCSNFISLPGVWQATVDKYGVVWATSFSNAAIYKISSALGSTSCVAPSAPQFGSLGNCPQLGNLTSGSTCSFACQPGYGLSQPATTCSNQIVSAQTCVPQTATCNVPLPPNAASLGSCSSAQAGGTFCSPTCADGYTLSGSTFCSPAGSLTRTASCVPNSCSGITAPLNGALGTCGYGTIASGTSCSFTCQTGYTLVGTQWSCAAGVLSGGQVCTISNCTISAPTNAVLGPNCANGILLANQQCPMTCNAGFMISGAPQRCVNGALNGAAQTCTASGTVLASWSQNYAYGIAYASSTNLLWYTSQNNNLIYYDYASTIQPTNTGLAYSSSLTLPAYTAVDR
jgi:hypothetical protein